MSEGPLFISRISWICLRHCLIGHILFRSLAFRKTRQFIYVRPSFYGANQKSSFYAPMLCRLLVASRKRRPTQVRIRLLSGACHGPGVVNRELTLQRHLHSRRARKLPQRNVGRHCHSIYRCSHAKPEDRGLWGENEYLLCRLGMDSPVI